MASDSSICSGVDSGSKNEYRDTPGGKGGRCVRLTAYHLHVPIVKKSGGLNLLESCGPVQACNGTALSLLLAQFIADSISDRPKDRGENIEFGETEMSMNFFSK